MAEQHHQKITIRVILAEADIRKVTLDFKPATMDDLIKKLKTIFDLQCAFCLQYEDPEFNYQLCNLTDIGELKDKSTIKIIPVLELTPVQDPEDSHDTLSLSSQGTEILSTPPQERQKAWPEYFDIPEFSVYIAQILRQADLLHLQNGTYLKLNREIKHEILEKLAESMYTYTAYPTNAQYLSVAQALVSKHPSLVAQQTTVMVGKNV